MTLETLLQSELWRKFEIAARSTKQQPADLSAEFINEYVESNQDANLLDEIEREACRSGHTEADAVRLFKTIKH